MQAKLKEDAGHTRPGRRGARPGGQGKGGRGSRGPRSGGATCVRPWPHVSRLARYQQQGQATQDEAHPQPSHAHTASPPHMHPTCIHCQRSRAAAASCHRPAAGQQQRPATGQQPTHPVKRVAVKLPPQAVEVARHEDGEGDGVGARHVLLQERHHCMALRPKGRQPAAQVHGTEAKRQAGSGSGACCCLDAC